MNIKLQPPEGFLETEIRSGFEVSSDMKKIWAVEIDLLHELDVVARKYGLNYWAGWGTLIGAIRHQGFIPWDDDIDVCMFREDYEKLCEIGKKEFQPPHCFQCFETEEGYVRGHAQLRNSDTTAILECERGKNGTNQGIFIDIIPLDSVPETLKEDDDFIKKIRLHRARAYIKSNHVVWNHCPVKAEPLYYFRHLLVLYRNRKVSYKEDYLRFEELCKTYNDDTSHPIGCLVFPGYETVDRWPRECFAETEYIPFEYIKIPAPSGYDTILRQEYGDYMKPVQAPTFHGGTFFDAEHSYLEYLDYITPKDERTKQKG